MVSMDSTHPIRILGMRLISPRRGLVSRVSRRVLPTALIVAGLTLSIAQVGCSLQGNGSPARIVLKRSQGGNWRGQAQIPSRTAALPHRECRMTTSMVPGLQHSRTLE